MPFQRGNKLARPRTDKPFTDALRTEIAAAGTDHKALRKIARNLLSLAMSPNKEALGAICAVADRLDGKPVQVAEVTMRNITAREIPDDELADIAVGSGEGVDSPSIDPGQLN